jgi:hypothetical protein
MVKATNCKEKVLNSKVPEVQKTRLSITDSFISVVVVNLKFKWLPFIVIKHSTCLLYKFPTDLVL